jgi:hypothetical protein
LGRVKEVSQLGQERPQQGKGGGPLGQVSNCCCCCCCWVASYPAGCEQLGFPHNPSQLLTAPHSPSQPLTAPHNPSQLLTAPHNPSQLLTAPHSPSQLLCGLMAVERSQLSSSSPLRHQAAHLAASPVPHQADDLAASPVPHTPPVPHDLQNSRPQLTCLLLHLSDVLTLFVCMVAPGGVPCPSVIWPACASSPGGALPPSYSSSSSCGRWRVKTSLQTWTQTTAASARTSAERAVLMQM